MPTDGPDNGRAGALYRAWTRIEEAPPTAPPALTVRDLVAFLSGSRPLGSAERAFLRDGDPWLRDQFEAALRGYLAEGPRRAEASGTDVAEMPMAVAASDDEAINDRVFAGGSIRIRPAALESEVRLTIALRNWQTPPAGLLIRNVVAGMGPFRIDLGGMTAGAGPRPVLEITLRRNLEDPDHAEQVRILRKPTSTGLFLR